jgi:hypothetical protein
MKFEELAKINVNKFTEKKGNLTYLSWAWAVAELLKRDDTATWEYRFCQDRPYVQIGETCMVFCTVRAFGKDRTAQLPVMDYKNKAISNPNAMDVNTAMQRCLAKAIALHGIGLYIYAGEDLPNIEPSSGIAPNAGALDVLSKAEISQAEEIAADMVEAWNSGNELGAYELFYDGGFGNEMMLGIWHFLASHSKIRNGVKKMHEANKVKAKEAA